MNGAKCLAVLLAGLLQVVLSQTDGDLRLTPYYQGQPPTEGLLEVYLRGRWGTICDTQNTFQVTEARIACRQLGFREYSNFWRIDRVNQTEDSLLQDVDCTSLEQTRLIDCVDNPGSHIYTCSLGQLVALRCFGCEYFTCNSGVCPKESQCAEGSLVCPEDEAYDRERCSGVTTTPAPTLSNGDLRLTKGSAVDRDGFFAGRLEMYVSGEWGTICERSSVFSPISANIACRQLGYRQAASYGTISTLNNNPFYPVAGPTVPIHLQDVFCHADFDTDLLHCHHNALGSISSSCSHSSDIGLNCSNCDRFLCSDGSCVSSCRDCPGGLNAFGVPCNDAMEPTNQVLKLADQGDLRLVPALRTNGFTAGRLEIFYAGQWGTICGPAVFGKTEADLACRQMGFHQAREWGTDLSSRFLPEHSTVPVWFHATALNCQGHTDQPLLSCADLDSVSSTGVFGCTNLLGLNCSSCDRFLCPEGTCVTECDGSWDCRNGEDEDRDACDVAAVTRLYGKLDTLIVFLVFLVIFILITIIGALAVCICHLRQKQSPHCKGYRNVPARTVGSARDSTPQIELDNKDDV